MIFCYRYKNPSSPKEYTYKVITNYEDPLNSLTIQDNTLYLVYSYTDSLEIDETTGIVLNDTGEGYMSLKDLKKYQEEKANDIKHEDENTFETFNLFGFIRNSMNLIFETSSSSSSQPQEDIYQSINDQFGIHMMFYVSFLSLHLILPLLCWKNRRELWIIY